MAYDPHALAPWLALACLCLSLAGFLAAAWMRTLFATIAASYAGALFAVVALGALAQGGVALAVVVVGAVGMLMAMGAALLSPRAARARPRLEFSTAGAAIAACITAALWAAPDVRMAEASGAVEGAGPVLLIASLICVGGVGAYALLGLGPRSALASRRDTP